MGELSTARNCEVVGGLRRGSRPNGALGLDRFWACLGLVVVVGGLGCGGPGGDEGEAGKALMAPGTVEPPAVVEQALPAPPSPAQDGPKAPEKVVAGLPVPKIAKLTHDDGVVRTLLVPQTVEQLRDFYVVRDYKPVDHPEGFAVFITENGPVIQVLRGVGPQAEIVLIAAAEPREEEPAEGASFVPMTDDQAAELRRRLEAGEPTEALPQPPPENL